MEPIFEVKQEVNEQNYGKFEITPLAAGYGHTMGQALKRVLLTSIPGAAITTVKIAGVKHQFSTLKGMKEDVLDFLLNLKNVRISYVGNEPVEMTLTATKEGVVTAADIKTPAGVTIANPDLVLATLAKGTSLEAQMTVESGVGYSPAEKRVSETIGILPVDAIFSPVVRVQPKIEETRVGRVTDYDKLVLEIWTDGTVNPENALSQAANLLSSYFGQITNPRVAESTEVVVAADNLGAVGKLSVEEIGLPTRVSNALVKSGYETVDKLVVAPKADLVKVRNLGEKSLKIIKAALAEKGVELQNA